MKNSKIINILNKLCNKDLIRLQEYLVSPIFNKNLAIPKIADVLLSFKDDFDNPILTYEYLLKKVYSKGDQKIEKLRNDLTLLFKSIKQFLAFDELLKSETLQDTALLKALRQRNMVQLFEKESEKLKSKVIEQSNNKKLFDYLFFHEMDSFFVDKGSRKYDSNLQLKMNALDSFYLATKLRESCEMLNRNAIYQEKYNIGLQAFLDEGFEQEQANYNETIQIYYSTYKMLKSDERKDFEQLVNLLESSGSTMPYENLRELYIHAQNFCTRKINNGNKEYFQDMFHIFEKMIASNLLLVDGFIPHTTYKNIVSVALNVEQQEWTYEFIEQHKSFLRPEVQQSAYNYNLAKYNYTIGSSDEAVQLLQSVNYEDHYYQIDSRYLLLKIFYETDVHESLLYQIDAFKLYLKRNKDFNITTREVIITFLKLLRKTAVLKNRKPYLGKEDFKNRYDKLKQQFTQNQNIPYRKWLELKLDNLSDEN